MSDMESHPATRGEDRELAEAVLHDRDEAAFRCLYRRHTPRLLGFVLRLLARTEAEAEEVVQETWLRACQNLDRFRWDSELSTWLLGIALNILRDHIRRSARSRVVGVDEPPDPPAPMRAHEDRIDLERAIAQLPDGYRMVLVLHDVEGMKHREIAGRLGITDGTSKSQLAHARKTLRTMLSPSQGDRT